MTLLMFRDYKDKLDKPRTQKAVWAEVFVMQGLEERLRAVVETHRERLGDAVTDTLQGRVEDFYTEAFKPLRALVFDDGFLAMVRDVDAAWWAMPRWNIEDARRFERLYVIERVLSATTADKDAEFERRAARIIVEQFDRMLRDIETPEFNRAVYGFVRDKRQGLLF